MPIIRIPPLPLTNSYPASATQNNWASRQNLQQQQQTGSDSSSLSTNTLNMALMLLLLRQQQQGGGGFGGLGIGGCQDRAWNCGKLLAIGQLPPFDCSNVRHPLPNCPTGCSVLSRHLWPLPRFNAQPATSSATFAWGPTTIRRWKQWCRQWIAGPCTGRTWPSAGNCGQSEQCARGVGSARADSAGHCPGIGTAIWMREKKTLPNEFITFWSFYFGNVQTFTSLL